VLGGVWSAAVSVAGVTTVSVACSTDRTPNVSLAATRNEYCPVGRMPLVIVTVVTSPAGCR
jgi:hypothetical protein